MKAIFSYCDQIKFNEPFLHPPPRGGVLHYMGYIGMCGPKEYGFSAVLDINRVSILTDFGHKWGMAFVL